MKKEFCLGDVLSITDGRLLSPTGIDGVYAILNHMTKDNLFTHQLVRAEQVCKPLLKEQFPELNSDHVKEAVDAICVELDKLEGKEKKTLKLNEWLMAMKHIYGNSFMVEQIDYESKDPVTELEEMIK